MSELVANMDGLIGRIAIVQIDGKPERCEIVGWAMASEDPEAVVVDPRHGGIRWVLFSAIAIEARP